jgi:hypothetical protein
MDTEEYVERVVGSINAEHERNDQPKYPWRPLPCVLDSLVGDFVRVFMQASEPERWRLSAAVPPEDGAFLTCFAERMASLGVRERSRARLLEGLVALVIEGYKDDFRSNMVCLAPLYDAALKIGVDAQVLFEEAAGYLRNAPYRDIVEFPRRKPENRSLEAMGYEDSNDAAGFKYNRTW